MNHRRTGHNKAATGCPVVALAAAVSSALSAEPALPGLTTGQGQLPALYESDYQSLALDALRQNMLSGGPPPDGIPPIEEPRFVPANEANLDPNDRVIGLRHNGVVKAYPHDILVYHEIVNETIGGENIAVTYCPLTATAQAFKTGSTTLGVSGRLVNSNLVMYDRDTGSLWSQINGTAIAGEHRGKVLEEVDIVWTTWEKWRAANPETQVLTEDTGFLRNYSRDPYGSYNPDGGYYTSDQVMFPLLERLDEEVGRKDWVIGGRTGTGAVSFERDALAKTGIQATDQFIGVYDAQYHSAHLYELGDTDPGRFEWAQGQVRDTQTGELLEPDNLPLETVIAVDAFRFAWHAFYPDSEQP